MSEPEKDDAPATSEDAPPAKADDAPPAKRKKKRREKKEATPPEPLPGEGTPEGALLREMDAAFVAGNYARVRELHPQLARAGDPRIVDAANELARRVAVDPVQLGFLGLCAIAICYIFYVYVLE
jgi:hypothetical protein